MDEVAGALCRCTWCGRSNVEASTLKSHRSKCTDCAKIYTQYATLKTREKKNPTEKGAATLKRVEEYYQIQESKGFKVPKLTKQASLLDNIDKMLGGE